jgi:hypothetical protein
MMQATEEYISWYRASKEVREQPAAGAANADAAVASKPDEAGDAALAKVTSLLAGRQPVAPTADAVAAANEFLLTLGGAAVGGKTGTER